ncbi:MAG: helix-turn-helix domain-containing protein [Acidimicrobiia bacterium]
MDTRLFDQQVGDLASSLGDATRRGIYIAAREAPEPVTASQIAELFAIHANVARHHLDRLVDDGYLEVSRRRRPGKRGPGAGRPAKHYEVTHKEVSLQFPARRYDLLSELLARMIERLAPESASAVAIEVGQEYGRQLAAQIGLPDDAGFETAVQAVVRAMAGVGFDTEAHSDERRLLTHFCPFGEAATNHRDIVCRLDQGIVMGLFEHIPGTDQPIVTPHLSPEDACITDV